MGRDCTTASEAERLSVDVEPRALPSPAIPPEDVQAILPSLTLEQATLAAQLATVAVEAALWPAAIPQPPPAPVYGVLLSVSVRFGQAILQGATLPIVSESLGSYSYRLATPASLPSAFGLTDAELEALQPWSSHGVYDVSIAGGAEPWPVDWWQRDVDNTEAP
jgi:hypothetical protein